MATTEVEQHVVVRVHDGVGLIQLNRPERMNAIGALTRKQLAEAIKQVERDDAVRVVVLTGSGRAFCSGADVTEMAQEGGMRTPQDVGNVLRNEYMPMLTRLRTMPKPVIAARNGPAGGCGPRAGGSVGGAAERRDGGRQARGPARPRVELRGSARIRVLPAG